MNLARTTFLVLLLLLGHVSVALAETVKMKSGLIYQGAVGNLFSIYKRASLAATEDTPRAKTTIIIDDELRRTFVPKAMISAIEPGDAPLQKIKVQGQRVADRGSTIATLGPIVNMTPFDEWGRRSITIQTDRGPRTLVQGITTITPVYASVEGLSGENSLVWDMRISTQSLSFDVISRMLRRQAKSAEDRLAIVRLFTQAGRLSDARRELDDVIREFPELAAKKEQAQELSRALAQELITEITLRQNAGQHRFARALASEFPAADIPGATLLAVRDIVTQYETKLGEYDKLKEDLEKTYAKIEDDELRAKLEPYSREILNQLNIHNMTRIADFQRFVDDDTMSAEQKVGLAVSGWVLGAGSGVDQPVTAAAIAQTRDLVRDYLRSKTAERNKILEKIRASEGGVPTYIAGIVRNLLPPIDTPDQPEKKLPFGMYELTVDGLSEEPELTYYVQLPPEYDPYRKYPCIVAMCGSSSTPQQEIDFWSGAYDEPTKLRRGRAARMGYVVLAPKWQREHQYSYEYSPREHASALFAFRDLCRRCSIDTDRVFITGHDIGGEAAWDIGLSHPDLWAGVVPIGANGEKFIRYYSENARLLSTYFVYGEKDGEKRERNGDLWDRYLDWKFDVTVVEYQGRGQEPYFEEQPRIFEWLEVKRRNFAPRKFKAKSFRVCDNFFWGLELRQFPANSIASGLTWPPPKNSRATESSFDANANNEFTAKSGAKSATIYLSPEIADFDKKALVSFSHGKRFRAEPNIQVILEDVRTRADYRHPYWAKVDFQ